MKQGAVLALHTQGRPDPDRGGVREECRGQARWLIPEREREKQSLPYLPITETDRGTDRPEYAVRRRARDRAGRGGYRREGQKGETLRGEVRSGSNEGRRAPAQVRAWLPSAERPRVLWAV